MAIDCVGMILFLYDIYMNWKVPAFHVISRDFRATYLLFLEIVPKLHIRLHITIRGFEMDNNHWITSLMNTGYKKFIRILIVQILPPLSKSSVTIRYRDGAKHFTSPYGIVFLLNRSVSPITLNNILL